MGFKTTLRAVLKKSDLLTIREVTSLGSFDWPVTKQYFGGGNGGEAYVELENSNEEQFGPFLLDQEIEVYERGDAAIAVMLDDDAEPGEEPDTFVVFFELTRPVTESDLKE